MPVLTAGLVAHDRVRPLIDGRLAIDGLDLRITTGDALDVLRLMSTDSAFDVGEYSFADHLRAYATGAPEYVALPVFTHRVLRHSMLWVRTSSEVTNPARLRGKRVGVVGY